MSTQSRPLLGDGGEWLFNVIKRNPERLLLLAAGAVLMMRTNSPQSSQAASIKATYGPSKDAASKTAAQMADAVTDSARRTNGCHASCLICSKRLRPRRFPSVDLFAARLAFFPSRALPYMPSFLFLAERARYWRSRKGADANLAACDPRDAEDVALSIVFRSYGDC